jgi:hypothetical protein
MIQLESMRRCYFDRAEYGKPDELEPPRFPALPAASTLPEIAP